MNPIQVLESDHRRVEALFAKLQKSKNPQGRQEAFEEIKAALAKHATLEECIFYPAVRTLDSAEAQALVSEAYGEHEDVKGLLAELEVMDPASAAFAFGSKRLKKAVAHHVKEEESELFPGAKRLLGEERLRALGRRMSGASPAPSTARKRAE